jgi:hypothetical protein
MRLSRSSVIGQSNGADWTGVGGLRNQDAWQRASNQREN